MEEFYENAYHCYYLAIVSQFGGKEDDAEKDKQRTEEVGIVGNEIQIVEEYSLPGCMIGSEAIHILIKVEYNSYTYDKQDGEEICPQELANQVSVYSL